MTDCDWHLHPRDGGPPKTAFGSRGAANRTVDYIKKRGSRRATGKKPQRSYQCRGCKRWFLTSDETERG
jgi:hypothetical protein